MYSFYMSFFCKIIFNLYSIVSLCCIIIMVLYMNSNKKEKIIYWILIFLIGSLIGWIYEEIFYLVTENIIGNRGFFYGPYLPVYGWGAIILMLTLRKLKKHPVLIFILSMLITGIVEYITGYVMYAMYGRVWWDYTGLFLNIGGYVCFRSIFTFAIGTIGLMYFIEPYLNKFIKKYNKCASVISLLFLIIFIVDSIITFIFRY